MPRVGQEDTTYIAAFHVVVALLTSWHILLVISGVFTSSCYHELAFLLSMRICRNCHKVVLTVVPRRQEPGVTCSAFATTGTGPRVLSRRHHAAGCLAWPQGRAAIPRPARQASLAGRPTHPRRTASRRMLQAWIPNLPQTQLLTRELHISIYAVRREHCELRNAACIRTSRMWGENGENQRVGLDEPSMRRKEDMTRATLVFLTRRPVN